MKLIKKIPVPICGLALGLASLGNLLAPYGAALRYTCGILSFIILLLFTLKAIADFKLIQKELENPVAYSVLPTYTMAFMLLATYIKPFIGAAAFYIWIAALVFQFIIVFGFVKTFVLKFNIKTVFPSWFIVFVGYVVGSITSPAMDAKRIGQWLFYVGFAFYFILLPIVLYRLIRFRPIPEPALPTIAILCAPISLCLAGYLSAFDQKSVPLVFFMLLLCVVSYLIVLAAMLLKLLRLKFYPSFSAFTFPLVISAVALRMADNFLTANGFSFLNAIQNVAVMIAALIVIFVLCKYFVFLFSPSTSGQGSPNPVQTGQNSSK